MTTFDARDQHRRRGGGAQACRRPRLAELGSLDLTVEENTSTQKPKTPRPALIYGTLAVLIGLFVPSRVAAEEVGSGMVPTAQDCNPRVSTCIRPMSSPPIRDGGIREGNQTTSGTTTLSSTLDPIAKGEDAMHLTSILLASLASSAQEAPYARQTDVLHPSLQEVLETPSYEPCGLLHFSEDWLASLLDTAIRSQQDTVHARVRLEDLRTVLSLVALHRSSVCQLAKDSRDRRVNIALQTAEVEDRLLTAADALRGYPLIMMAPDTPAYATRDVFLSQLARPCRTLIRDPSRLSARLRGIRDPSRLLSPVGGLRPRDVETAALYDDVVEEALQLLAAAHSAQSFCDPTTRLRGLAEEAINASIPREANLALQTIEIESRLLKAADAIRGYHPPDIQDLFRSWRDPKRYLTMGSSGQWSSGSVARRGARGDCLAVIRDPSRLSVHLRKYQPRKYQPEDFAARYQDAAESLQLYLSASAHSEGGALCRPSTRLPELVKEAIRASNPLILDVDAHILASAIHKAQAAIDRYSSLLTDALLGPLNTDSLRALLPLELSDLHRITEDAAAWELSDENSSGSSFDGPLDSLVVTVSVRSACIDEPTGQCGATPAVSRIGGTYVGSARDLPHGLKQMLDAGVPGAVLCGPNGDLEIRIHPSDGHGVRSDHGRQDINCDRSVPPLSCPKAQWGKES